MNKPSYAGDSQAPEWLREWADTVVEQDGLNRNVDPVEARDFFQNILTDLPLIQHINGRFKGNAPDDDEKLRLFHLLEFACWIHHSSKDDQSAKPSVIKRELRQLAKSADRLASVLNSHEGRLGRALDIDYLVQRLASSAPQGFSGINRGGLRETLRLPESERVKITDVLEALRDDITEEITMFSHRRLDRLDGGKDARLRYQIKALKKSHRSLFGRDDDAFIGRLIVAGYGTSSGPDDPEQLIRRIRKTKI